ncbi:MAG: bifunctional histidinal dehydrogenase/histidinol dehydrogenase [Deltaproteobacteria bacterium]|nr:bifunctional histidinal dehydrogenase/histidinol dehydrogenase [Deltaproteobacteria bacterium]
MRILKAGTKAFADFIGKFSRRGEAGFEKVENRVRWIVTRVKRRGDPALVQFTRKYDGWPAAAKTLRVNQREIKSAVEKLSREERDTLEYTAFRIEQFHLLQKQPSWNFAEEDGTVLGQIVRPLEKAGIYVPGGKAAYPSSVLMNAIPARVAGVPEIIMTCPAPQGYLNPRILAAAKVAGVETIFKIGGAQAVAALAYGTKTVPKVDKIVGPGNIFVAAAKRMVFGEVSIDSIAGPSEIFIIADGTGIPAFLAADLLSQAEHDELASAILCCTSRKLAEKVREEVRKQSALLPRRGIAAASLRQFGTILLVKSTAEACRISNRLAPEHLELAVDDPFSLLGKIENAGAIFLGHLSPEAIGDYVAGPNHVLPTGGAARFSSPLGVYDFIKRSSLISLSPEGLKKLSQPGMYLARMEGLEGHARSIQKRQVD